MPRPDKELLDSCVFKSIFGRTFLSLTLTSITVDFSRRVQEHMTGQEGSVTFLSLSLRSMTVYSRRAPNTKMIQAITQHSMAVRPSAYDTIFLKQRKIIYVNRHKLFLKVDNKELIRKEIKTIYQKTKQEKNKTF